MSPVKINTSQISRLSKIQKINYPKRFFESCVRKISKLRSVLKTKKQVRNTSEVPLNKKQVRFAVPLDDSRYFKGFTTNYLSQIGEKLFKMATIRKALDLKQKTAVWKAMRKNHGVVPIKNGSTKYFLCSKKLCHMPNKAEKKIVAQPQPVSLVSQQEKVLPNNLKITNMIMMQCKVCCRKAYFPNTQPNISSVNLNLFICNDCFLKSKSMVSKTSMPLGPQIVRKTVLPENNSDDELEDRPIIITSVRSLSTQNALECQDKEIKPAIDVIDLEPISASTQHEQMEKTPPRNNDDQDTSAVRRDVKTEKEESGHGKKVTVRTSEGYFTFIVPNEFEDQTDSFELLSGQSSGTADDPILIDDM